MWDEQDTFGRWVQGIFGVLCAVFVAAVLFFGLYLSWLVIAATVLACYLGYRSLRYAITGRNNINRDSY